MKSETKTKIRIFFAGAISFFAALLFLLFGKKQPSESETNTAAEQAAQKAKEKKEHEIEKTDSNILLAGSAHTERNDTTIAGLKDEHKERVRARIRQELQR